MVIQAFITLKESNVKNDYKLILAGRKGFGFEEYEKLIVESKYKKDIIVTGYLSANDIVKLYNEAAAYIFPSIYEGFGSTQLECMVNHLPLILSDIPTNREVSQEYGLFFELGNRNKLVEKMLDIVNQKYDYEEKNSLADLICKKYLWEELINDYIKIYKEISKE